MIDLASYILARVFVALFALLPLRPALAIGRAFGAFCFHVLRFRRGVTLANLRHVLGDRKSEPELKAIAAAAYRNFGMTFVELLRWSSPRRDPMREARVDYPDFEEFRARYERRSPVLPTPAHFGNFDLAAIATIARGVPAHIVMKPLKSERANRFLVAARARHGMTLLLAGAGAGARSEEALRRGEVVAMLPDQNAKRRGVAVDFLGKPAAIFRGPAQLALATGAAIMPAVIERDPADPTHHTVHIRFLPVATPTGDAESDVRALTQAMADAMSELILRDPSQYFWFHRLWGKKVAAGEAPEAAPPEPSSAEMPM